MLHIFILLFRFALSGCELRIINFVHSPTLLDEASDIVRVGDSYYLVMDDLCGLAKVGAEKGEMGTILPPPSMMPCSKSDNEALFRVPGDTDDENPSFYVCGEDTNQCNLVNVVGNSFERTVHELVDGGEGCHNGVNWGKNKGIEGAVGIMGEDGATYMLAVVEGTGTVITYKLTEADQWVSQACTNIPVSMKDYSGMAYRVQNGIAIFAVTSQKGQQLWIGTAEGISSGGRLISPDALLFEKGTTYRLPGEYKGVEGVFIERYSSATGSMWGALSSDDQAKGEEFRNGIHKFELYCGPEAPPCCKAFTAKCLSCAAQQSVEEYCVKNPSIADCPDQVRPCCRAMTAKCLSCVAGESVDIYCAKHPSISGCVGNKPGVRPCCLSETASCLSCKAGESVKVFCSQNPDTVGCPGQDEPESPWETRIQLFHNAYCKDAIYLGESVSDLDECQQLVKSKSKCSKIFSYGANGGDCMCVPVGESCEKATSSRVHNVWILPEKPRPIPARQPVATYAQVRNDAWCSNGMKIDDALNIEECVTNALQNKECGDIIHYAPTTSRTFCVCLRRGIKCQIRASTLGNNIYKINKVPSRLQSTHAKTIQVTRVKTVENTAPWLGFAICLSSFAASFILTVVWFAIFKQ